MYEYNDGRKSKTCKSHSGVWYNTQCRKCRKNGAISGYQSLFTALKRGDATINGKEKRSPFYMLLPMNIHPRIMEHCNLLEFVERSSVSKVMSIDEAAFTDAVEAICNARRITVKAGGGCKRTFF
ncbi:MAG: hypothetical protein SOW08_00400 [Lachnospiraceae bacterium]|nr:hypothetical protein [Lachnospiraceae bacterium]